MYYTSAVYVTVKFLLLWKYNERVPPSEEVYPPQASMSTQVMEWLHTIKETHTVSGIALGLGESL